MDEATWSLERRGRIGVLHYRRPPENLLGFVQLAELDEMLLAVADDLDICVVVLIGDTPGFFVGHADIGDVERLTRGTTGPGSPDAWATTLERLAAIPQPVVAAVNGQAWGGGCELALAAQIRVAAVSAHFRFVEVAAGAIPGAGGTQRLPRLIGSGLAGLMVLGGEVVPASQALQWGLVQAVLPDEGFLDGVLELIAPIARQPRHALSTAKRALLDGARMPLGEGLAYEQRLFRALLRTPETAAIMAELDQGA